MTKDEIISSLRHVNGKTIISDRFVMLEAAKFIDCQGETISDLIELIEQVAPEYAECTVVSNAKGGRRMREMRELMFVNSDATPKVSVLHVSIASIPACMAWYGAYYSGDQYIVKVDGRTVAKDKNGELIGDVPPPAELEGSE